MTAMEATVETPATEQARLKMTYDEYLAWAGEENFLAEWVNGEVIVHMPATQLHQSVSAFLYTLLRLFVEMFRLGRVFYAPFEMKLSPTGPAREPDVLFVATASLDRLGERRLAGPADLAIEIIFDDSVVRDREDKFFEYEAAGACPSIGSLTRDRSAGALTSTSSTNGDATSPLLWPQATFITPASCPASGSGPTGCGRSRCPTR